MSAQKISIAPKLQALVTGAERPNQPQTAVEDDAIECLFSTRW